MVSLIFKTDVIWRKDESGGHYRHDEATRKRFETTISVDIDMVIKRNDGDVYERL